MCLSGRSNSLITFEKLFGKESTDYDGNPSKGWYGLYPFVISEEPDFDNLVWSLAGGDVIALVRIDIGRRQPGVGTGSPFTDAELDRADRILTWFEKHSREVILRITYDTEGKGMEHEPSLIKNVAGHMRQLGPVIAAHADNIIVHQGIFVGSWGEMHDSKFLSENAVCELYETLVSACGNKVRIAVRTPMQHRFIMKYLTRYMGTGNADTDTDNAYMDTDILRPALYNDAILSSEDDMCTYAGGRAAWADYQDEVCAYAVCGGEAIHDNPLNDYDNAVKELANMHITYLNRQYDMAVLDKWRSNNGYDYIGTHLGYRFVVTDTAAGRDAEEETGSKTQTGVGSIYINVRIANRGFACVYDRVRLLAEFRGKDGGCISRAEVMSDMSRIKPGDECTAVIRLPQECSYMPEVHEREMYQVDDDSFNSEAVATLWLRLERVRDAKVIRFANEGAGTALLVGVVVRKNENIGG
ncbi:MAG: DUF4832 domain-containing protein [[Bacteroides] pectinophilus]|nr:DUF4832 domain-containing protein [[Bacteroides] pectinophilus]